MDRRTTCVLLAGFVMLAASSAAAAQRWGREPFPREGVCFFKDPNFSGDYFCAGIGDSFGKVPDDMNDRISSLKVFGRAEVTVFRDARFGGGSTSFRGNIKNLKNEGWNDRITSLRVGSSSLGGGQDPDRIIRRAYQDILHRDPDEGGYRQYRSRIQRDDWTEDDVRNSLRSSPEYRELSTMTPAKAQEIVRRAYQAVLRRDVDPGAQGYVDRVIRDHWTQADVERELRKSPDTATGTDEVEEGLRRESCIDGCAGGTVADTRSQPTVRKGQGSTKISRDQFKQRWRERFYNPIFDGEGESLDRLEELAWKAYEEGKRSPRTSKAGAEFANPEFKLPVEWLDARRRLQDAAALHDRKDGPSRILLICASPRSDETCPGEMSKTFRLVRHAQQALEAAPGCEVDLLDLSQLTSEHGRTIFPCKACVSTAMPLCHWPCSCYPNHALGQVNDWMNEIYPRWVHAHGVMIVTPVHWYQAPSVLKLMMDRLVCADGGNPDPTTTDGKKPEKAKALELSGWDYPKHLRHRAFSIVVHGDTVGAETVRRALHDWLSDMALVPAGAAAVIDRYIGYYEPYAVSHEALDRDAALMAEVENAARTLVEAVGRLRAGVQPAGAGLRAPRPK